MSRQSRIAATDLPSNTRALSEIGANQPAEIERVTGNLKTDAADLEAFMHEIVEIRLGSASKDDLPVETPNINGINQPIVRGVITPVKRKYVESLLRSHSIDYRQETRDSSKPDQIDMRAFPVFSYPVEIVKDTAKGQAWCQMIRQQVAQEVARA